jgi:hypothetical protein
MKKKKYLKMNNIKNTITSLILSSCILIMINLGINPILSMILVFNGFIVGKNLK